jgi:hypothetical protein
MLKFYINTLYFTIREIYLYTIIDIVRSLYLSVTTMPLLYYHL